MLYKGLGLNCSLNENREMDGTREISLFSFNKNLEIDDTAECADVEIDMKMLSDSMDKHLKGTSRKSCTIVRMPPHFRDVDKTSYEPKILSIGPFNHGRQNLQAMEKIKCHYFQSFLKRCHREKDRYDTALERYVKAITECEDAARAQYNEKFSLCSWEFLQMMVLDGCFIIELLVRYGKGDTEGPLYANSWTARHVRMDLLLLENQIPFFVLQSLFEVSDIPELSRREITLTKLAVHYLTEGDRDELWVSTDSIHHLLYLLYLSLCPAHPSDPTDEVYQREELTRMIPCATDLRNVGVQFSVKKGANRFIDVTFKDGVMEIPAFNIEEITKPQLQNLIALEQSLPELQSYCSSYAWFMDNLMDTAQDVGLLREKEIIHSNLGSNKDVASYFNTLCRRQHISYKKHHLNKVFVKVNEYSREPWNAWLAVLRKAYFSTPWSSIAFACTTMLFFLTVTQTYFAVRPAS